MTDINRIDRGDRFSFGGFDWVCLDPCAIGGEGILAIMADIYRNDDGQTSFVFDKHGNGNYAESDIRKMLENEIVPKIGAENLLLKEVDLTADNGDDTLGCVMDLVSIMSADEYRKYRKIIPEYGDYIWTCTPWVVTDASSAYGVRICNAAGGGALNYNGANYSHGVAPLVIIKKIILEQSSPLGLTDSVEEIIASDEDLQNFLFNM